MEREFGRKDFTVDQTTGEAIPNPATPPSISLDDATAYSARLGNIDAIGHLRTVVASRLSNAKDSIILNKVIHSGSHSGDALRTESFHQLRRELELLSSEKDPFLREFVADMRALLAAAEKEGNPIAFV